VLEDIILEIKIKGKCLQETITGFKLETEKSREALSESI